MFKILLFLAALSASTPPSQGEYLFIGEDEKGMGVVDAASVERDGDRARIIVIVALSEAVPGEGRVVQYLQEWDCRSRKVRILDGQAFDEQLRPTVPVRPLPEWTRVADDTRFAVIGAYVCQGRSLPGAGSDFRTILARFLAKLIV